MGTEEKTFSVYILECNGGTLYCGYAADLKARVKSHNDGKGAKYTKGRLPARVVYSENLATKSEAMKRENEIKRLSRAEKIKLIEYQTLDKEQQAEDKR